MRINQDYLRESVDVYKPIPRYNNCMIQPCYRIGEGLLVGYDFDKVVEKLRKTGKATPETAIDYLYNNFDTENNVFIKIFPENLRSREIVSEIDENMLFCDGLDDAIVGYRVGFGIDKNIAVYNYEKCVQCLVNEGMSDEEAIEYLEYNTLGGYVGEYTPCFLREI